MSQHQDAVERLQEEFRKLDRKLARFLETYHGPPRGRRYDLHRSLDRCLAELELAGHWMDKAQKTLDEAIAPP